MNYVIGTIITKDYSVYGEKDLGNMNICSGGFLGKKGEAIVDNYKNPKYFYAICDGIGGVEYENVNHSLSTLDEIDVEYN